MILLKTIRKLFFSTILLVLIFNYNLSLAEKYVVDSEILFNYANEALHIKDYNRAINEFKKFLYYFPNDKREEIVRYNIALANYSLGNFETSEKLLQNIINSSFKKIEKINSKKTITFKSYKLLVKCYESDGKIQLAVNELRNLTMLTEKIDLKDLIHYETGKIFFRSGLFLQAQIAFKKISKTGQVKYNISIVNNSLKNSDDIPSKSPTLAGILAIVPGGGYLYTNRYRDALVSFIFNGLMIYATYEAFDVGNEGLGAILGFVETGFYMGNIYGSYNSAKKYSRYMKRKYIEQEQSKFKIAIYPNKQNDTYMLGALFTF
jgi:tetratricopeptide (TPR) repeat protein